MGPLEGLFVGGTVRDRRRQYINKSSSEQGEIVTYTLTDSNDRNFYVEDYAPSSYRNIMAIRQNDLRRILECLGLPILSAFLQRYIDKRPF